MTGFRCTSTAFNSTTCCYQYKLWVFNLTHICTLFRGSSRRAFTFSVRVMTESSFWLIKAIVQKVQNWYLWISITSDKCPKCPFHLYRVEYFVSDFCDTFKLAISTPHHLQAHWISAHLHLNYLAIALLCWYAYWRLSLLEFLRFHKHQLLRSFFYWGCLIGLA